MPKVSTKPVLIGLAAKVRSPIKQTTKPKEPVWRGPMDSGPNGGVTQSLISRFLCCPARFHIMVIEGYKTEDAFSARMEYGNMFHVSLEAIAKNDPKINWEKALLVYCKELTLRYRNQQPEIDKFYNACLKQFPIYLDWWKKHPDEKQRTPLFQEQVFKVPHKLPSGRVVYLRGKYDAVDLIGVGKKAGIYLQENKTKSEIDQGKLTRLLMFDLQTGMYLISLDEMPRKEGNPDWCHPIKGVRYNVIKRPLSGGKGSIKQLQGSKNVAPETKEEYYNRLQQYFVNEPHEWFARWKVEVTPEDINAFKRQFLDPILERMCDWYEWVTGAGKSDPFADGGGRGLHYRYPTGIFNPVEEHGFSDVDEYLINGSTVGLRKVTSLFTALV
jgi:hypothetical protein